ncbi:MAG: M20/M25/M40 family metallo-hydrolase [bacterium]|nr:M20/M25/M40 family metallo-hydrolase [bacterium]
MAGRSLLILLLFCGALFPDAPVEAETAGPPAETTYLVVIDVSAQELLRRENVPVIWKSAGFFIAEWNERQLDWAAERSVSFEIVARDLDPQSELYLLGLEEDAEVPVEWLDRALFRKGRSLVVTGAPAAAGSWHGRGFGPESIRMRREPRGWSTAGIAGFGCAFDPLVQSMLDQTDETQWRDWIEKLSGEESITVGGQQYDSMTRYSPTLFSGSALARGFDFAVEQAESWGFGPGTLEQDPFSGTGGQTWKNLVLSIPGQTAPNEVVLITAHFDSTSSSASTLAPGADDNGTGSAALFEAARLFRQYRFQRTIRIVWFAGEEQGLLGSEAYVADHPTANFLGAVNMDMIGYDDDGDRCFELHVGTLADSQLVGDCFRNSITKYNLNLSYDYLLADATDRSDHAAFWQVDVGALAAVQNFFSDGLPDGCVGMDRNPDYHQTDDTIDNVAPSFGIEIARASLATVAKMAVPIAACFDDAPVLTSTPGVGEVDLGWAGVGGAASYRVYRSTQGCNGQWLELGETANTFWLDDDAVTTGSRYYQVEAVDADGFCVSSASNCSLAAALAAPPGEPDPLLLTLSAGDLIFDWTPPEAGCQASGYAVYRGDLDSLRAIGYAHDTALVCDQGSTTLSVAISDPRLGAVDYFLAVAANAGDEGSYGRDSAGLERPVSAAACRSTQELGACPP